MVPHAAWPWSNFAAGQCLLVKLPARTRSHSSVQRRAITHSPCETATLRKCFGCLAAHQKSSREAAGAWRGLGRQLQGGSVAQMQSMQTMCMADWGWHAACAALRFGALPLIARQPNKHNQQAGACTPAKPAAASRRLAVWRSSFHRGWTDSM